MRLAISMRGITDTSHGEARDALSQDWVAYLTRIWPDSLILPLPNQPQRVSAWLTDLAVDGVILSNGNSWQECPRRDVTEQEALCWCLQNDTPLLGVCRGLQVVNLLFGGTHQTDIAAVSGSRHAGSEHTVELIEPQFVALAGAPRMRVNSYHDQGILLSDLAGELKPFALAEGQVVEGLFHESKSVLAIQWHPERANPASQFDERLLQQFFAAPESVRTGFGGSAG